jgi:endonuclease/exonuclease/phosphatase (EEP) superfamily protein YafD
MTGARVRTWVALWVRVLALASAWGVFLVGLVHASVGDRGVAVVWLHALATWWPLGVLPALVVAGVDGVWTRSRWSLATAIPCVLVLLAWGWANRPPSPPAPLPDGPRLVLVSANHLMVNPTPEAFFDEWRADPPDVLLVQEHTPLSEAVLDGRFPHVLSAPETHSFGEGLYSRHPFLWARTDTLEGVYWQRAAIEVDGVAVELWNVHTLPPVSELNLELWQAQIATLVREARRVDGPLIIGGDFNLTGHMAGYDALTEVVVDAHRDCGRWVARTWPANGLFPLVPAMVKLDHVFLGGGVRCAAIEEGTGAGSDHRPIRAELVLPR